MAELLQRQWNLPVLRVHLDTAATVPAARCELAAHDGGERVILAEAAWPLTDFGFPPGKLAGDQRLDVPDALVQWVAGFVAPGGELADIRALWVHLVKPYGHLGGVPWERLLVPAIGRPVVRLPDVLPAPQVNASTLAVALCATGAAVEGPSPATRHLVAVAGAIARAAPERRLTFHVFADRDASGAVAEVAARLPQATVVDHVARGWADRSDSRARSGGSARRGRGAREGNAWRGRSAGAGNPWLTAMRDALHGRGIDVVHFICHGYHTGYGGALLFAGDPTGARGDWPSSATAAELGALLTDLGAADIAFTAPDDNYSEAGLLELADGLGVDRPGTTLVHDARLDPEADTLEAAYRLLLRAEAAPPPPSPALAWVVQPRRIEPQAAPEALRPVRSASQRAIDAGPATKAAYASDDAVPGWLATAERFIEQQGAEVARYYDRAADMAATPEEAAYYDGVEQALERIRGIVESHAGPAATPAEAAP